MNSSNRRGRISARFDRSFLSAITLLLSLAVMPGVSAETAKKKEAEKASSSSRSKASNGSSKTDAAKDSATGARPQAPPAPAAADPADAATAPRPPDTPAAEKASDTAPNPPAASPAPAAPAAASNISNEPKPEATAEPAKPNGIDILRDAMKASPAFNAPQPTAESTEGKPAPEPTAPATPSLAGPPQAPVPAGTPVPPVTEVKPAPPAPEQTPAPAAPAPPATEAKPLAPDETQAPPAVTAAPAPAPGPTETTAVPPPQPAPPPVAAAPAACNPADFRIAIDVGHTETNYGAVSAHGKPEYEFNLRLANELLVKLLDADFAKSAVVIQTDSDLFKRARDLSSRRPNLMLSLHHDSVQDKFLKTAELDGQMRTFTEGFRGYSIFISRDNAYLDDSEKFAKLLGGEMMAQGLKPTFHHHEQENRPIFDPLTGVFFYDGLVVLRQTTAPAALLESAVITNPEDEQKANDKAYRNRITNAIVAAVTKFCDAVAARALPRAASPPAPKPAEKQGSRIK